MPTPGALDVDFKDTGRLFSGSHLLLTQGGGPDMTVEATVHPGGSQVVNTNATLTSIWPPVTSIELAAILEEEVPCAEVAGIAGGCATLPRKGHRVVLDTHAPAAHDPCVKPAGIDLNTDAAAELLTVNAAGNGGGPGVWRMEAVVTTAEVPAGSCTPPTFAAHAAGSETDQADEPVYVAVRLVDMVAE